MNSKKNISAFSFSLHDCLISLLILTCITILSFLLQQFGQNDRFIPMLFILAVFLISRYTTGYIFGTISSILGVFLVNYIFTYPYFEFNFTISGYPITFLCMLVTSVMTSALTTRIKQQELIRIEVEKEKMRGNLLRAVSHDLRTPLTSILGTTSALIDNDGKISHDNQLELLKEAHDDAEWLIRMVENLLSVTRMNGKGAQIRKNPEAIEEIIGEAVRKFKKQFPNAEVSVEVPDELLMVPMDPILIEQVIINLLENAVEHGKRMSGIRICVSADAQTAVITVSDKGIGIPEAAFAHLFDGYLADVSDTQTDNKRNMGIGLSVCMSIVKAHKGNMTAKNKSDGGAEFCFTLPLKNNDT